LYKKVWTDQGSPLLVHGLSLERKLQKKLGDGYRVRLAMNYRQPDINAVVLKLLEQPVERIIAFPLFPQYASSTTGSVIEKLLRTLAAKYTIPAVTTIMQYYDHPAYLEALASKISGYDYPGFDHLVFSYHSLPLRQVNQSHPGHTCESLHCTKEVSGKNRFCYHAACYATSRLLAGRLNLDEEKYTVCFQSRITKRWLSPFTDEVIVKLAKEGKKRILVVSPSFIADCLETILEIGHDYKNLFLQHGGTELTLVESLNDSEKWIDAISRMIMEHPVP
jgi:ferrochelatase